MPQIQLLDKRGSQLLRGDSFDEVGDMRLVPGGDCDLFLIQFILSGEGAAAQLEGSFNRMDWHPLTPIRSSQHSLLPHPSGDPVISTSGFYYYAKVPTVVRASSTGAEGSSVRAYA